MDNVFRTMERVILQHNYISVLSEAVGRDLNKYLYYAALFVFGIAHAQTDDVSCRLILYQ